MKKELKKYFPIATILILLVLSFIVIKDYILALISSFILAYLVKPLHDKFSKKIPKTLSAFLCVLIVVLVILIPVLLVTGTFFAQFQSYLSSENVVKFVHKAAEAPIIKNLNLNVKSLLSNLANAVVSYVTAFTLSLPSITILLLITIFGIYYILLDWDKLTFKLKRFLPSEDREEVSRAIAIITRRLMYGTLLVAAAEFVVAAIGFWLAGVPYFLLLAALIGIFAFIPGLGPIIVWVPVAIIMFVQKMYYPAIGVTITGLFITIFLDTVLLARISGKGTKIPPLVLLVGVIGGVVAFGIFGFILGPLLLSYTLKILEEIMED